MSVINETSYFTHRTKARLLEGRGVALLLGVGHVSAVRLLDGVALTRLGGRPAVQEVMLEMPPHEEAEALHTGPAQLHLPLLAGDGGGHLVLRHPPHQHSGQLLGGVDLSQPHQLGDRQRLEAVKPLLVVSEASLRPRELVVDICQGDEEQTQGGWARGHRAFRQTLSSLHHGGRDNKPKHYA